MGEMETKSVFENSFIFGDHLYSSFLTTNR